MAASTCVCPTVGQPIPYPPPLRDGEKVQQRLMGRTPVVVADAHTLSFVLDPRLASPCNSSLTVRHASASVATVGETGDGLGTYLAAGDLATPGPTYLSLQTTSDFGRYPGSNNALFPGSWGASSCNEMVERLRVGPGGLVTVPAGGALNVVGDAVFYGAAVFNGATFFGSYGNLVDDFTSTSIVNPPTANALTAAYASLSNLIVARTLAAPGFWPPQTPFCGGGGGGGGWGPPGPPGGSRIFGGWGAELAPPFVPLCPPDLASPAFRANPTYGWWATEHGPAENALVAGPVACATLFVADGGSVVASSYCNLVDSFRVPDPTLPPSAFALNAAYVQLSNLIAIKVQQAELYGILDLDRALSGGGASNGLGGWGWGGVATAVKGDLWIQSVGDGVDRMLFPSTANAPAQFAAGPSTSPDAAAFEWVRPTAAPPAACNAAAAPLLSLTQRGDLSALAGLRAGAFPLSNQNATTAWTLSVSPGAAASLSNASLLGDGSLRFAGSGAFGGALSAGGAASFASDARVAGVLTAAVYSNLPLGSTTSTTPGAVALADDPCSTAPHVAATPAALRLVSVEVNQRCDYLQGFLAEATYAAYLASNQAFQNSNLIYAEYYDKAFDAPSVVPGLTLTNRSTDPAAGVRILLGVGVGPDAATLAAGVGADRAFVPDPIGSNCASIEATADGELRLTGPTTTTYVSSGSGSNAVVERATCVLAVAGSVDVRQGPDGSGAELPSDPAPSATSDAWTDPETGAAYVAVASSVLFPGAPWCAARQGLSADGATPWISGAGTYDLATGYPAAGGAATTGVVASSAWSGSALGSVAGEWLELDVRPGAFATAARLVAPASLQYLPDDFVLLASEVDASTAATPPAWTVLLSAVDQAMALAAAGAAGLLYPVSSSALESTRFASFRLVVTRVAVAPGFAPLGSANANVQVGALKLVGSVFAPLPPLLFTVDGSALVVDRAGHVGVGRSTPKAPVHLGALDGLVASAPPWGVPAVVLLDASSGALPASNASLNSNAYDYRGIALAPDALVHAVETFGARHAFYAGSNELMSLAADGELSVAGTVRALGLTIGPLDGSGGAGGLTTPLIACERLYVSGAVGCNLAVEGGAGIGSNLGVAGNAAVAGGLTVAGNAVVAGVTLLSGPLAVVGATPTRLRDVECAVLTCDRVALRGPSDAEATAFSLCTPPGGDPTSIFGLATLSSGGASPALVVVPETGAWCLSASVTGASISTLSTPCGSTVAKLLRLRPALYAEPWPPEDALMGVAAAIGLQDALGPVAAGGVPGGFPGVSVVAALRTYGSATASTSVVARLEAGDLLALAFGGGEVGVDACALSGCLAAF